MATFRIHTDQENVRLLENKKQIVGKKGLQSKQNRTVLGQIDNQKHALAKADNGKKNILQAIKPTNQQLVRPACMPVSAKIVQQIKPVEKPAPKKLQEKPPAVIPPTIIDISVENTKHDDVFHGLDTTVEMESPRSDAANESIISETDAVANAIDVSLRMDNNTSAMSMDVSLTKTDSSSKTKQAVREPPKCLRDLVSDIEHYRDDIYSYMRERECSSRPKPGYMKRQPDINTSMRRILVDWLVEVAEEYKLQGETLFLAIQYIDRFLSYMSVVRAKLQLLGTAAMYVAAKYEEIYPPEVNEFVYITDDSYSKRQVLRMERLIVDTLNFDLSIPTILSFIKDFCTAQEIDEKTLYLAQYYAELSLLEDAPFLQYLPSHIASASVALARYTLNPKSDPWPASFIKATDYTFDQLKRCMVDLSELLQQVPLMGQQAIPEKYKHMRYLQASLVEPRELPASFLENSQKNVLCRSL